MPPKRYTTQSYTCELQLVYLYECAVSIRIALGVSKFICAHVLCACVHISAERPTLLPCFQELSKRLEENDAVSVPTVSPDTPNVLQTMMKLRHAKSRTEAVNKVVLEDQKETLLFRHARES
jgi:hypothetical protein